jgi:hypothetical protein
MSKLITDEEFYCCKCGKRGIPISRQKGKARKPGHLKKIWCLNCKEEVNHVECQPLSNYTKDEFELEFGKNFDENFQRILPFKQFRHELFFKKTGVDSNE